MNRGQRILGQFLLGNSYSTTPRRFIRFNIAEIDDISRIQTNSWVELQMAFGQTRPESITGADFHNSMHSLLVRLAAAGNGISEPCRHGN